MLRTARRTALVPALACLVTLALSMAIPARSYERHMLAELRERVGLDLAAYATALSAAVTQRLALVVGLHAFVLSDGAAHADERRFESFASALHRSAPGVRAFQLIRGDVIRATWPPQGNEKVVGWNLARDPRDRVRAEYLRTLEREGIAISGPFTLLQGGLSLVARLACREHGQVHGAVAVIIDVPKLLQEVGLDPAPAGLRIALRDQSGSVFWGPPALFSSEPVVHRLELQDGAWELAAVPAKGWHGTLVQRVWLFRGMASLIALLTALVVFLLVRGQAAHEEHAHALERKQFELLRKALRVIGHEVNNSLAPVRSMLHSARQMVRRPEMAGRLEPVIDLIAERTEHLRDFLEGYAQLARLPAPAIAPVQWKPFLDELRLLYPFKLREDPPPEPAPFDRAQLQQALINLLKNARESGSPPEQIEVDIRRDGDLTIAVLDRGPGIPPAELAKTSEPFFTTKRNGSGLGLHLCREIARAHGGALELAPRDGGGLEARIRLPLQ